MTGEVWLIAALVDLFVAFGLGAGARKAEGDIAMILTSFSAFMLLTGLLIVTLAAIAFARSYLGGFRAAHRPRN